MIVVFIIGIVCIVVGLIVCLPIIIKHAKCKEHIKGRIVDASVPNPSDQPIRAFYEYIVDGKTYKKKTRYTEYAVFVVGSECDVFYNKSNPQCSYMKRSGQVIPCVVGIIFSLVGVVVLILGAVLSQIL